MAAVNGLLHGAIDGVPPECLMTSSRVWLGVRDVMSRDVVTVSPDDTLASAANAMAGRNISCVVVLDKGAVTGILTERDLLRKAVVGEMDVGEAKVRDVMSSPVECTAPKSSVLESSGIMEEKHIRRLPVLHDGQLVGIITQTDLTKALTAYGLWKSAEEVMSRGPAVVQTKATVAEAAKTMSARNASCVVVLEGEEVAGVLTERDVLRRVIVPHKDPVVTNVGDVMSSPVLCIDPHYSIFSAGRFMERSNCRRLVIAEDKRLLGIITQTDIFKAVRKKLQESEEENLAFLEKSEHGIYTADLDETTTYVNKALAKLLGVASPRHLLDQPFLPEKFWLDPQERAQFVGELKAKAFVESREVTLVNCEGKRLCVSVSSNFTKNIHGEIDGSQGILRDISADKELKALMDAKEALRDSEERYRALSQNVPVGLYRSTPDPEGEFIMANQAVARIHGYDSVEELLEIPVADLYEDPAQRQAVLERLLDRGEIVAEEVRLKKRDGTLIWGAMTAKLVRDESGEVKWFDGMIEDITDRKRAEEATRSEKEKLQALMDGLANTGIGIDIVGIHYDVHYQNKTLRERFGDLTGEVCYEKYMGMDEPCDFCPMTIAVATRSPRKVELTGADGRQYEILSAPLPNADGTIDKAIEVVQDITERKEAEEKVRFLSSVVEQSSDGMAIADLEGKLLFVNQAWARMHGYESNEELLGRHLKIFHNEEQLGSDVVPFNQKVVEQGSCTGEVGHIRKDGTPFPALMTTSILKDETGKPTAMVGIARDISELKKAGEEAQAAYERVRELEHIVNKSPAVAFLWRNDEGWPVEFVSDNVVELFGYTAGEFTSGQVAYVRTIHPDDLDRVGGEVSTHGKEEGREKFEHEPYRIVTKDGTVKWISDRTEIRRDEEGRITHYQGIVEDITDRKLAEERSRESEERQRTMLNSLEIGVVVVEPGEHRIVEVNPAAAKMIGCSREAIIGRQCHKFICPSEVGRCPLADLGKRMDRAERVLLRADGESLSVLKTVVPITLNGREHYLESFVDISERKRGEEELARRAEELQIAKDAAEENATEKTKAFDQLNSAKENLERFNKATVGREMRIIEVKHEVNALLRELGREPKYEITDASLKT